MSKKYAFGIILLIGALWINSDINNIIVIDCQCPTVYDNSSDLISNGLSAFFDEEVYSDNIKSLAVTTKRANKQDAQNYVGLFFEPDHYGHRNNILLFTIDLPPPFFLTNESPRSKLTRYLNEI